jgi:hypothetical protein
MVPTYLVLQVGACQYCHDSILRMGPPATTAGKIAEIRASEERKELIDLQSAAPRGRLPLKTTVTRPRVASARPSDRAK